MSMLCLYASMQYNILVQSHLYGIGECVNCKPLTPLKPPAASLRLSGRLNGGAL